MGPCNNVLDMLPLATNPQVEASIFPSIPSEPSFCCCPFFPGLRSTPPLSHMTRLRSAHSPKSHAGPLRESQVTVPETPSPEQVSAVVVYFPFVIIILSYTSQSGRCMCGERCVHFDRRCRHGKVVSNFKFGSLTISYPAAAKNAPWALTSTPILPFSSVSSP